MLYFPNAKINLGLHVTEKRPDGFHNLETVFYPILLSDVLEVLPRPQMDFRLTGIAVDGNADDNLCMRAYRLLQQAYNLPPIYMQLHKLIPMGAGLGGGSADAAFVLCALNAEFKLNIGTDKLKQYAAKLGSDCAFFIENRPCLATGRGEVLTPISLDLKGWYLRLVKPNVHVSTAEAYAGIIPQKPQIALADIITQPIEVWKDSLVNDFEVSVFARYPQIAQIKQQLYDLGATYAAMSGSGSSVFGLFREAIDAGSTFNNCFVHTEVL